MLDQTVKNFERAFSKMEDAVVSGDENSIREQDRILTTAWNELLEYEPMNDAERQALATFLLKKSKGMLDDPYIMNLITDRVIYLIADIVPKDSISQNIAS